MNKNMPKAVCIGSTSKDIFFPTKEGNILNTPEDILSQKKIAFELGAKYKIEKRYEALGGCAANVASGLVNLGIETLLYSSIGKDNVGDWILEELEKKNIKTKLISIEAGFLSGMSAVIVDENSSERVIFSNQRSSHDFRIDPEMIKDTDWIFIGDLHGKWEENLEIIIDTARDNKIPYAMNPRQSHIHENPAPIMEAIKYSKIIFLNKDEAMEILKKYDTEIPEEKLEDVNILLDKLHDINKSIIVITDGLQGAWVTGGNERYHCPIIQASALDATGTGDAFCSAFMASYLKKNSLSECLMWGIANGAGVVEHFGAHEGLRNEHEISRMIEKLKVEKI